ncbi:hypothetical protein [Paenibacillus pedocola]|uniref:hypothetical protein n=1 Tax=Paenibacillus pedocola TaxID=3242193 RepID=UPI002877F1DA|nr:hypothetical protein [Paenibacillus typhae]
MIKWSGIHQSYKIESSEDVVEWSSKQIAKTLAMSPAAVSSALQKALETMDRAQLRSDELSSKDVQPEQQLLSGMRRPSTEDARCLSF